MEEWHLSSMDDYAMNNHIFNKMDSSWGSIWAWKKSAPSNYQEQKQAIEKGFYMDNFFIFLEL